MSDFHLSPTKASNLLYPDSIHDVARAAVNAQPDLEKSDDRQWISSKTNYEILYPEACDSGKQLKRNFRASSLMHDTVNELICQGYQNGISNNPEGIEQIIDRAIEANHPTNDYLNMKARELQEQHELEPNDIKELKLWGRDLEGVKRDVSENIGHIKSRLNGDSMRPETESYQSFATGGMEYRTMADLRFDGDKTSEVSETKIKWNQDPGTPFEQDILQARLTAYIHESKKAYLVYAGLGEVYEFAPLSEDEFGYLNQKIEPLLRNMSEIAGWESEVDELEPEVVDLIRSELDELFRNYYRSEVVTEENNFDHDQTTLKAF